MIGVINGRHFLFIIYIFVTLIACGEMFFSGSFSASGAGLLGSALCCFGPAGLFRSWRARREKNYGLRDLSICALAVALGGAGIALLVWSGFRFRLFDVVIEGFVWAGIGMVIAIVAVKSNTHSST